VYPEPEQVNPQRWLDEDSQLRKDMRYFRFGFGRRFVLLSTTSWIATDKLVVRICVGEHPADRRVLLQHCLPTFSPL